MKINFKAKYPLTGLPAIDEVNVTVSRCEYMQMPLDTLHLKPELYAAFRNQFDVLSKDHIHTDDEVTDETVILFGGVKIIKGSIFQVNNILEEYYDAEQVQD